jgi:hypothetical protein
MKSIPLPDDLNWQTLSQLLQRAAGELNTAARVLQKTQQATNRLPAAKPLAEMSDSERIAAELQRDTYKEAVAAAIVLRDGASAVYDATARPFVRTWNESRIDLKPNILTLHVGQDGDLDILAIAEFLDRFREHFGIKPPTHLIAADTLKWVQDYESWHEKWNRLEFGPRSAAMRSSIPFKPRVYGKPEETTDEYQLWFQTARNHIQAKIDATRGVINALEWLILLSAECVMNAAASIDLPYSDFRELAERLPRNDAPFLMNGVNFPGAKGELDQIQRKLRNNAPPKQIDERPPAAGEQSGDVVADLGDGDWLMPPVELKQIATALNKITPNKAKNLLLPYGLQNFPRENRQSWTVDLARVPEPMRSQLRNGLRN